MKTAVLIYEGFVQFEVIIAANFLQHAGSVTTLGVDLTPVRSSEGFLTQPDIDLQTAWDADVLLVPGGDAAVLQGRDDVIGLIQQAFASGAVIGAICGGPVHLARAGILAGRRYTTSLNLDDYPEFPRDGFTGEDIAADGSLITAKPNAYVDFALELGRKLDIFEDEADYRETVAFFRDFQDVGD